MFNAFECGNFALKGVDVGLYLNLSAKSGVDCALECCLGCFAIVKASQDLLLDFEGDSDGGVDAVQ